MLGGGHHGRRLEAIASRFGTRSYEGSYLPRCQSLDLDRMSDWSRLGRPGQSITVHGAIDWTVGLSWTDLDKSHQT